ncbi:MULTISPECIES: hypothetical protein [Pseudomonadati]|uniref:hypothetical protein n=1 Tax=Pseudomonadati TaxID=3379134 RepID=UPI0013DEBFED|nr:hypothetical protein [Vibrio diabolicus]QOV30125.1 hypothetical protein INT50_01065 [Vibrio diabolicus]
MRIIKNGLKNLIGILLSKGSHAITLFILARILTNEDFGRLTSIINSVNSYANALSNSIIFALTKNESKERNLGNTLADGHFLLIISIISSVAYSFFILIYINYFGIENFLPAIVFFGYGVSLIIESYAVGKYSGQEKYGLLAKYNAFKGVVYLLSVFLVTWFFGFWGAIVSISMFWLIATITLVSILLKNDVVEEIKRIKTKPNIWVDVVPIFLSGLMVSAGFFIAQGEVYNASGGFLELSYFNSAFLIYNLVAIIGQQASFPIVNKFVYDKSKGTLTKAMVGGVLFAILLPLPLLIWSELTSYLLGEKYSNPYFYQLQTTLLLTASIVIFKQLVGRFVYVNSSAWFSVLSNAIWGAVFLYFFFKLGVSVNSYANAFLYSHLISGITSLIFIYFRLKESFRVIMISFLLLYSALAVVGHLSGAIQWIF